jgi:hypothetical protein
VIAVIPGFVPEPGLRLSRSSVEMNANHALLSGEFPARALIQFPPFSI